MNTLLFTPEVSNRRNKLVASATGVVIGLMALTGCSDGDQAPKGVSTVAETPAQLETTSFKSGEFTCKVVRNTDNGDFAASYAFPKNENTVSSGEQVINMGQVTTENKKSLKVDPVTDEGWTERKPVIDVSEDPNVSFVYAGDVSTEQRLTVTGNSQQEVNCTASQVLVTEAELAQ